MVIFLFGIKIRVLHGVKFVDGVHQRPPRTVAMATGPRLAHDDVIDIVQSRLHPHASVIHVVTHA